MRLMRIYCIVCAVLCFNGPSAVTAQQQDEVPQPALDALQFFVGGWESEDSENDRVLGKSEDVRRWAKGNYCITMVGRGTERGKTIRYSGISGWDARGKQIVEHWYSSDGMYIAIRYPLRDMKDQEWSGTLKVVAGDGTENDGTCELKKTNNGFIFTARATVDGKETVRRSVARRVQQTKDEN